MPKKKLKNLIRKKTYKHLNLLFKQMKFVVWAFNHFVYLRSVDIGQTINKWQLMQMWTMRYMWLVDRIGVWNLWAISEQACEHVRRKLHNRK